MATALILSFIIIDFGIKKAKNATQPRCHDEWSADFIRFGSGAPFALNIFLVSSWLNKCRVNLHSTKLNFNKLYQFLYRQAVY